MAPNISGIREKDDAQIIYLVNNVLSVIDNLLKGDYTGFKFTASNSVKDLTYIQDLLKDFPEAEKVAEVNKNYFQKAVDEGFGENFISELINKK